MKHIRPRDWREFQHYKSRSPIWIKLHRSLLDDFEFQCLPVGSRALAPMLWLLASEDKHGLIDAAPARLSFRLRLPAAEVEDALAPLVAGGFFEAVSQEEAEAASSLLAEDDADASPEKRREEPESDSESESEQTPLSAPLEGRGMEKSPGSDFEAFWRDYPTDPVMSKSRALAQWQRLSPAERAAARAAIPAFRHHVSRSPTTRPLHAERYLSQKRFEGLSAAMAPLADEASARSAWNGLAAPLVAEIGAAKFLAWFGEAEFKPGPPAVITVKRKFQKNWIAANYDGQLRRVFGEFELRSAA